MGKIIEDELRLAQEQIADSQWNHAVSKNDSLKLKE